MRGPATIVKTPLVTLLLALALLAACSGGAAPAPVATAVAPTAAPTTAPTTAPQPTTAPTAAPTTAPTTVPTPALVTMPWWNNDTFYEIFVRSFQDSNGDGIGDFKGLISKLDYLNDGDPNTTTDLGVTGIWLMPIMPSPSYHGYDVTDYKDINPQYGTIADFKQFLAEAHKRGIKVIIDLVLNHTSSQHPWFVDAQDPKSPKHDWYIWSDNPTGSNWHKAANGLQYYGYFGDHMPDLNYNNPQVTDAVYDVVKFWLQDVKVDGFRLDAIMYLFESGKLVKHVPATFDWLAKFHTFYTSLNPQAFTVGEVYDHTTLAAKYVPDKLDAAFEFTMAEAMLQSALRGDAVHVARAASLVNQTYPPGQFAPFLANHDQNRTRSRLLSEEQAFTAASMELLYGGVPFIYYGEEIGMQGTKPDENIRRPMQWTAEGGFTTGKPWNDYFGDEKTRNVAAQDKDAASLLNHYRSLIRLRNTYPALRTGDWRLVAASKEATSVYSFMRSQGDERFLVLINLGSKPVTGYTLSLEAQPGATAPAAPAKAELVFGPKDSAKDIPAIATDGFEGYTPVSTLPPYSTFVIRYYR
jgi:glycosidase